MDQVFAIRKGDKTGEFLKLRSSIVGPPGGRSGEENIRAGVRGDSRKRLEQSSFKLQ